MSVQNRRTTSAVALDELKRRRDLESLRKFLISEQCFPATKDPITSIITMEELKKLARIWKLNERRNFWKTHSERNEMVTALLEHSEQNKGFMTTTEPQLTKVPSVDPTPMPPIELKPSMQSNRNVNLSKNFKNYCGIKYFNRDNNPIELLISSRFYDFPDPASNIDHVVDAWRSEDFNMKDEHAVAGAASTNRSQSLTAPTPGRYTISQGAAKNKVKMLKHRNLAAHLMNYSANTDLTKTPLTLKAVQTFINVAETDDIKTVSNCMIALSNISSSESVRLLLFEINAMHKFTNFLQYTKGHSAQWAAALMFYYFSCDKDGEDRVYNSCSTFVQSNGQSVETDTRLVALYTMNNLMPCIDRQRVVDIAMRIINTMFDMTAGVQVYDKTLTAVCLLVIQNMSCFSNAHISLFSLNVLELLTHFAKLAVHHKNADLGMSVVKVLNSFLLLPEQAANLVNPEYVQVLVILLQGIDQEALLVQAMKAATFLSCLIPLRSVLRNSVLVSTVAQMVLKKQQISNTLGKDVSRFLSNVTLSQTDEYLIKLVEDRVPDAVFHVLKSQQVTPSQKSTAVKALQNILGVRKNAIQLAEQCFDPLIKMLRDSQDLGAAQSLYNIACVPECRSALVDNKIHFKMLDLLPAVKELNVKSAYLQILVQMSSSNVCVIDMLNVELIAKLEAQLRKGHDSEVWRDISTMLLAVVAFAAGNLSVKDQLSIIHILAIICVKGVSSDEIIENASNVLKYVSVRYGVFEELNPVVRSILDISDSEIVIESLSTVLYNMTCTPRNVGLMLQDEQYVNIMIRVMRSGKVEVQENIAQAMRTLCSEEKCTQILLKNDILSDLIVIALLRTSSEEIKVVCSEAFYNMLCHDKTRLRLLKGDLWWAVMRLCRTDSNQVRKVCARALFDLSCDLGNIGPLREHHVLSFIRDISTTGNDEFMTRCLHSVHNIIRQFSSEGPNAIASHEVVSSVRIGTDALSHCTSITTLREALTLLLKCAQQDIGNGTDTEFINMDIVLILENTKQLWSADADCRLYVSRLLWELSKSGHFTKSTSLADLDATFCSIYSSESAASEITDNIAAVFLQFVLRERVPPAQFILLPIWEKLLNEALAVGGGVNSGSMSSLSTDNEAVNDRLLSPANSSVRNWKARATLYKGDTLTSTEAKELLKVATTTNLSFATRGSILSILAYSTKEHISGNLVKTRISKNLVTGILTSELLDNPLTRTNLLHVVHALSEVSTFTLYMVEADVFRLLSRYLNNSMGTNRQEKAQEFCATFLHNVSLHANLVSKLIATSDGSIDRLLRDVMEVANPNVLLDLTVFFYNVSACLVNNDASLNPRFILEMINKVTAIDADGESMVANINKFTISIILNTYSFESGVDPSFVQSMFTYMQNNPTSIIPDHMEQVRFKSAVDVQAVLLPDFIRNKVSIPVSLCTFDADTDKWQPTASTECKCNQNIILKFTQALPTLFDKLEHSETYASPIFSKIVKQFDMVKETMTGGNTDNVALVEGDDEDLEEDDEDELSITNGDLSPDQIEAMLNSGHDINGLQQSSYHSGGHDEDGQLDGGDSQLSETSGEVLYNRKFVAAPPVAPPSLTPSKSKSRTLLASGSNSQMGSKAGSNVSSRQQIAVTLARSDEYSNASFEE